MLRNSEKFQAPWQRMLLGEQEEAHFWAGNLHHLVLGASQIRQSVPLTCPEMTRS